MSFKSLVGKEINQARPVMHRRGGFALEATMFVLVLMAVLMLSAYSGALSTTRASKNLDYRAARVSYAAEGGADAIVAQLADALDDGLLENGELASVQPPEIEGFSFSQINVRKMGRPRSWDPGHRQTRRRKYDFLHLHSPVY